MDEELAAGVVVTLLLLSSSFLLLLLLEIVSDTPNAIRPYRTFFMTRSHTTLILSLSLSVIHSSPFAWRLTKLEVSEAVMVRNESGRKEEEVVLAGGAQEEDSDVSVIVRERQGR